MSQLQRLPPGDSRGRIGSPPRREGTSADTTRTRALRLGMRVIADRLPTEVEQRDALFRRMLGLADVLAVSVALYVVVALAAHEGLLMPALLAPAAVIGLSKALGLYDRDQLLLHKTTLDETPKLFQLATLFTVIVWLLEAELVNGALHKVEFLALWATVFVGTLATRGTARSLADRASAPERCLLLGSEEAFSVVESKLALSRGGGTRLVARADLENRSGDVVVAGRLRELVRTHRAHRLILAPDAIDSDAVLDTIREAKAIGAKISIVPRFSEVLGSSVVFDDLHGITVLGVRQFALSRSSRILKRSFDVLVAGVGIAVTAPLLATTAIAIRLDSGGPVIFRQTRVGRGGRTFHIFKFRTMVREADELRTELEHLNETDGLFKIEADPRLTRVGRWLRRISLDELPQLFNVLRGDMSIVGPRPLVIEEDRLISGWHRQRLDITPGMTGHWQVLGSSRLPLQEMLAIDYLYVVNWSLWADLKYLLRTVPYVLRARGM